MTIHHILKKNSVLNTFIKEIRDPNIQKDSMRFRRNIERIGEILSYELSKSLLYSSVSIETPLGEKKEQLPNNDLVVCSVLRAGLPLHQGLLNYFDKAENAFISAYRHHPKDNDEFEIVVEYFASPTVQNTDVRAGSDGARATCGRRRAISPVWMWRTWPGNTAAKAGIGKPESRNAV